MASEGGGPWEHPEAGEKCGINTYCGNKHALYLGLGAGDATAGQSRGQG